MKGRPFIDRTNLRYGKLVVIELVERREKHSWWRVSCECGSITVIRNDRLHKGFCKPCGTKKQIESIKRNGSRQGANNHRYIKDRKYAKLLNKARRIIRIKKWEVKLSLQDVMNLIDQPCHYCGSESVFDQETDVQYPKNCNGLDRVDSKVGYVPGNVVPCCTACNYMKLDTPLKEFKDHVSKIYRHLKLNG